MKTNMVLDLTPERAHIYRITHKNNIPWILDNGLHCANSRMKDPHFAPIGNPDLISKRRERPVPIEPCGVLSDYVPFYFTSRTPMLHNILTGWNVPQISRPNIVILASSLRHLAECRIPFVFTDRNAYMAHANYSSDMADLNALDWENWRNSDFKRDPQNPEKIERYHAEALAHQYVPVHALLGIACYDADSVATVSRHAEVRSLKLQISESKGAYC